MQKYSEKRSNYFSFDETFILSALTLAQRSKDPNTQVGAYIVNESNLVISCGYNGFPRGVSDDDFSWSRDQSKDENKYLYVVHAEANAVATCPKGQYGNCRLYTTLFPCNMCAGLLIQAGIKEIVYLSDKYHDDPKWKAARDLFEAAGIRCHQFKTQNPKVLHLIEILEKRE